MHYCVDEIIGHTHGRQCHSMDDVSGFQTGLCVTCLKHEMAFQSCRRNDDDVCDYDDHVIKTGLYKLIN